MTQLALRRWPNVGIGRHRRDRQLTSRQRWYSVACAAVGISWFADVLYLDISGWKSSVSRINVVVQPDYRYINYIFRHHDQKNYYASNVNKMHGSHRPGKVMEFNPWLEKSLNFMLTWKNGILPGKVIENQWKSLKKFMCHVKLNLNLKIMMIEWFKVSVCHHIWDQIGETMLGTFLAELLVTLLQVAAPLVALYQLSPVKQHMQRKH